MQCEYLIEIDNIDDDIVVLEKAREIVKRKFAEMETEVNELLVDIEDKNWRAYFSNEIAETQSCFLGETLDWWMRVREDERELLEGRAYPNERSYR